MLDPATIIDFIFGIGAAFGAVSRGGLDCRTGEGILALCGLCAIATIWMPVPRETTGAYAAVYRWVHGFALHFGQNRGAVADGKSEAVKAEVKAVTGK